MAGLPVLSAVAILDTSWLLELYRVPGSSDQSRYRDVSERTIRIVDAGGELIVTVPVLFEVANHITQVPSGRQRREVGTRFSDDVKRSIDGNSPWTILAAGKDILLRSSDIVRLADRFRQASGANYSFANISIIDLTAALQERNRTVEVLSFNERLSAYSVRNDSFHP